MTNKPLTMLHTLFIALLIGLPPSFTEAIEQRGSLVRIVSGFVFGQHINDIDSLLTGYYDCRELIVNDSTHTSDIIYSAVNLAGAMGHLFVTIDTNQNLTGLMFTSKPFSNKKIQKCTNQLSEVLGYYDTRALRIVRDNCTSILGVPDLEDSEFVEWHNQDIVTTLTTHEGHLFFLIYKK